jgi:hypothetical protein
MAACQTSAVNLELQVFPDGSGELKVTRVVPTTESPDRAGVIKGVIAPDLFRLEFLAGPIESLSSLKIGDIQVSFEPTDGGFRLRLEIPTTATASWYQSFGLTEEALRALESICERERMVQGRTDAPKQLTKESLGQIPSFVFLVKMPGVVTGSRLVDQDIPVGWYLSHEPQEDTTILAISLRDLPKPKIKQIRWEIESGPLSDENREAWERNLRDLKLRLKKK